MKFYSRNRSQEIPLLFRVDEHLLEGINHSPPSLEHIETAGSQSSANAQVFFFKVWSRGRRLASLPPPGTFSSFF